MSEHHEVERERILDAAPSEVWEALTDEALLSEWLGEEVELDPVEGGELVVRDAGEERTGRVESLQEERTLAFTWWRDGEEPSRVELTLVPAVSGTRLRVVESAPAGPDALARVGPLWEMRLGGLARLLEMALV